MRTLIKGLLVLTVAAMVAGCAARTKSGPVPAAAAEPSAGAKTCVMQSGGRGVLRLAMPSEARCTPTDGRLHVEATDRNVDFWLVAGARTVDEGIARVGQVIKPEFEGFKATSSTPLTVAGEPATRLTGSGTEADDGDPGEADVVVFKAGGNIFIACTHGESILSASRQWMMTLVQSARTP